MTTDEAPTPEPEVILVYQKGEKSLAQYAVETDSIEVAIVTVREQFPGRGAALVVVK